MVITYELSVWPYLPCVLCAGFEWVSARAWVVEDEQRVQVNGRAARQEV